MPVPKNIVFISHDATRTGAPALLLNLAEALLQHGGYNIHFLIKQNRGDLYKRFAALAPLTIAGRQRRFKGRISRAIERRLVKEIFDENAIKRSLHDADIVISNTITNGDILPYVRKYFKGPVFSYIHELKMAAEFFTNPADIKRMIDCTDHFLCCSEAVRTYLEKDLDISPAKIDLLRYYIPSSKKNIAEHAISTAVNNVFTVGGVGTTDWRKGPELFVAIAALVYKKQLGATIQFVWKGATENSQELARLQYDVDSAGLNGKIIFSPASGHMPAFYASLSLLLLSSREDPYPLVVLEAAQANVPTICFEEAGGATEFVGDDAGFCIKYLDLDAMSEKIIDYYNNRLDLQQAGIAAHHKFRQWHQQPEPIIAQLESIMAALTVYAKQ